MSRSMLAALPRLCAAVFHRHIVRYVAIVWLVLQLAPPSGAEIVVGGFDGSRGGRYSLRDGNLMDSLRVRIANAWPEASLAATTTLAADSLAGMGVFLAAAVKDYDPKVAIDPLTMDEQAALFAFVLSGRGAILLVEQNEWPDGPMESLIDAFGLSVTGRLTGLETVSVPNPTGNPITNGPFGTIASFTMNYVGWLDVLGPNATSLGTLQNGQSGMAFIDKNVLGVGSGAVLILSDASLVLNPAAWTPPAPPGALATNLRLMLNAIAYSINEPPTVVPSRSEPCEISLSAPRPNPASERAFIQLSLPTTGDARLDVFDVSGRFIRRLPITRVEGSPSSAGWDLRDEGGRRVAPGVYLLTLFTDGERVARRVVVPR